MTDTASPRMTLLQRWHRLRTSSRFPFVLFFGLLIAGGLSQIYCYWWGVRIEQMLAHHGGNADRIDVFPTWNKSALGAKWLMPLEPICGVRVTYKEPDELSLSADDLRLLRGALFLRELTLTGQLSPEACEQLGCLTQLRSIRIYGSLDMTMESLRKLPRLTSLELPISESTDPALFQKLAAMTQLEQLSFGIAFQDPGQSEFATRLRDLAKSPSLLELEFVPGDDEEMLALTSLLPDGSPPLPQLRELRLGYSKRLTDRSLANLKNLPSLVHLDVSYSGVTNEGLKQLRELPYLKTLYLEHCRGIEGEGFEILASMHNLETVNVKQTKISNEGLLRLAALPQLRCLHAHPGGPESRAELRKLLPARCELNTK